MKTLNVIRLVQSLSIAVLLGFGPMCELAWAANYPLEITAPRSDLHTSHRMLRAYPGLEYNIRVAAVGGAYPYVYSLSNAPSGMSIDSSNGRISWTNPTANASPTVTIRDVEGAQVSQTWNITVGAAGFRFVDAVGGSTSGAGTAASPWRSLLDVNTKAAPTDIIYFKRGTYLTTGLPRYGSGFGLRVEFNVDDRQPIIWLAYPGERPVIDLQGAGMPFIRLQGPHIYVDGFEVMNCHIHGFQSISALRGAIFRNMVMHGIIGGTGANAAFIMTPNVGEASAPSGMVVQDSRFYDGPTDSTQATTLKFYYTNKLLVEDTTHYDIGEAIAVKESNRQFTLRRNTFRNIAATAIGGNMADNEETHGHSGEILYNNVLDAGREAVWVNQHGQAGQTFIYRNTFQGAIRVLNVDSTDGPFVFTFNVIINSDRSNSPQPYFTYTSVTAPNRIVVNNNLMGSPSDGIVDSAGNLTAGYQNYRTTHGHLSSGATTGLPSAPTNVRILR